jgi:hypothetical protein
MDILEKINNVIAAYNHTIASCIDHFDVRHFGLKRVEATKQGRLQEEIKAQEEQHAKYMAEKDAWCLRYFVQNFSRFENTKLYKEVIGEQPTSNTSCLLPFKQFTGN